MTDFDNKEMQEQPEAAAPASSEPASQQPPAAQQEPQPASQEEAAAPQPEKAAESTPPYGGHVPHLTLDPNEAEPFRNDPFHTPEPPGRRNLPSPNPNTSSRLSTTSLPMAPRSTGLPLRPRAVWGPTVRRPPISAPTVQPAPAAALLSAPVQCASGGLYAEKPFSGRPAGNHAGIPGNTQFLPGIHLPGRGPAGHLPGGRRGHLRPGHHCCGCLGLCRGRDASFRLSLPYV